MDAVDAGPIGYPPITIDLAAAVLSAADLDTLHLEGFEPGQATTRLPESFTEGPYPPEIQQQWRDAALAGVYRRSWLASAEPGADPHTTLDTMAYEFASSEGAELGLALLAEGWPGITMPRFRGDQSAMYAASFTNDDGSQYALTHMYIRVGRLLGQTTFMTTGVEPFAGYEQRLLDHVSERVALLLDEAVKGNTPGLFLVRPLFALPATADHYLPIVPREDQPTPLADYVVSQQIRRAGSPRQPQSYRVTSRLALFATVEEATTRMAAGPGVPDFALDARRGEVEQPADDMDLQRATWLVDANGSPRYVNSVLMRTDALVAEYALTATKSYPGADPGLMATLLADNLSRQAWFDYSDIPDEYVADAIALEAWQE